MSQTTTDAPVTVTVQRIFNTSAGQLFDAWVNPDVARQFFFATATGSMVRFELDPHAGGNFTVIEKRPKDNNEPGTHEVRHVGRYLTVDHPRRLAFRFSVPQYSAEESTVTLHIQSLSGGESSRSELTLTHELGDSDTARQYRDRTAQGWRTVLDRLGEVLDA